VILKEHRVVIFKPIADVAQAFAGLNIIQSSSECDYGPVFGA
jgi:hypothetical protein